MKTVKLIDAKDSIESFFKGLFDKTNKRIMSAERHGVSEAIDAIKEKTKKNVSASSFKGTTSAGRTVRGRAYTTPLIEGVQAYMWQGVPTGFVHIMGTPRVDDGTWRLRWFEMGTRMRRSKNGGTYGRIQGNWFFSNAYSSIGSDAITMIQESIQSAIDEINNSN